MPVICKYHSNISIKSYRWKLCHFWIDGKTYFKIISKFIACYDPENKRHDIDTFWWTAYGNKSFTSLSEIEIRHLHRFLLDFLCSFGLWFLFFFRVLYNFESDGIHCLVMLLFKKYFDMNLFDRKNSNVQHETYFHGSYLNHPNSETNKHENVCNFCFSFSYVIICQVL